MVYFSYSFHKAKRSGFLVLLFLFFFSLSSFADNRNSVASGNWGTNGTWSSNDTPDAGDVVSVISPHVVFMNANEVDNFISLTVAAGATLNCDNRRFTNMTGVVDIYGTIMTDRNNSPSALEYVFPNATVVFHPGSTISYIRGSGNQYHRMTPSIDISGATIDITAGTTLSLDGDPIFTESITGSGTLNLDANSANLYVIGSVDGTITQNIGGGSIYISADDLVAPTLTSSIPSTSVIYDINATVGGFTLTLGFSEYMNQSINPTITFPTGGEDPLGTSVIALASGVWTDTDTYLATYNVTDQGVDIPDIDVVIATAKDLANNVVNVASATLNDHFSVVLDNPEVSNISVNDDFLTKSDGSFVVTATYTDVITNTPTLNFYTEDPSPTLGAPTVTGQGSNTIVFTYAINTAANYLEDVDIEIIDGEKAGGVKQSRFTQNDVFSINTDKARVLSVTANLPVLSDTNEGTSTFIITTKYDLSMNTVINPTVDFPTGGEDPSAFLTPNSELWTDAFTFVKSYDVANVNLAMSGIDVRVSGAQEADATVQELTLMPNVFSISTSVTGIIYVNSNGTEDETTISDAIAGASDGNQIVVRAGTYTEDIAFGNKELVLIGDPSTPSNVIIQGTGTGPVVTFSNSAKEQEMRGFVVENGAGLSSNYANVTSHGQNGYYGGGIIISKASDVTIANVIIRNNTVTYDDVEHNGGSGGGVYIADNSTVTMTDCTITGNVSEVYRGGGLCIDKSVLTATNLSISSNAGGHYGGGLAAYNSIMNFNTVVVLTNSLTSGDAQGADTYLHQTTINDAGGCNYGVKVEYSSTIL